MNAEFKKSLIKKITDNLEAELAVMVAAAIEARNAATHEESIAEDKYDTRGLEASYLAGAQAKRASELQRVIHSLKGLELATFKKSSTIASTALLEVAVNSKKTLFFILPKGGGISVKLEDKNVQVVTPDSKLGSELVGKHKGDLIEIHVADKVNEYEILNIF